MSVRMRHTRGHSGNRRSHHGLTEARLSTCGKCASLHLRHHACETCGSYRGKDVINVEKTLEKKVEKSQKREKEKTTEDV